MAPGRWARGDRPTGLTCCPAGGAPQEGEGQPQQHGVWLRVSRVLEKKTGHPPLSEGPPTSLGSMTLGGEPRLTWSAEAQAQSWLGESCTTVPATQPFIPSWALWDLSQKEGTGSLGSPKGAGKWGLFPGESPQPTLGGSRTCPVGCLGPVAAQTRRQRTGISLSHRGSLLGTWATSWLQQGMTLAEEAGASLSANLGLPALQASPVQPGQPWELPLFPLYV